MADIRKQSESEVEKEDLNGENSTEVITKPFNPNEIDVDISTVNLGSLIEQFMDSIWMKKMRKEFPGISK
mgnify:CR=1 FL=1